MLPGEAAAVRDGALLAVHPRAGRPRTARAHERDARYAAWRDQAPGHAAVKQRNGIAGQAWLIAPAVIRPWGLDLRIGQIIDQGVDRGPEVGSGHDQDWEVGRTAQVGAGGEGFAPAPCAG